MKTAIIAAVGLLTLTGCSNYRVTSDNTGDWPAGYVPPVVGGAEVPGGVMPTSANAQRYAEGHGTASADYNLAHAHDAASADYSTKAAPAAVTGHKLSEHGVCAVAYGVLLIDGGGGASVAKIHDMCSPGDRIMVPKFARYAAMTLCDRRSQVVDMGDDIICVLAKPHTAK